MSYARCYENTKSNLMNVMCGIRRNFFEVVDSGALLSRLARGSPPWAGGLNPLGIRSGDLSHCAQPRSHKKEKMSGRGLTPV